MPSALSRPVQIPFNERLSLSVAEGAQWIGMSERSIKQAIYDGRLKAVRIGRRVFLKPDVLRAWFDSHAVSAS